MYGAWEGAVPADGYLRWLSFKGSCARRASRVCGRWARDAFRMRSRRCFGDAALGFPISRLTADGISGHPTFRSPRSNIIIVWTAIGHGRVAEKRYIIVYDLYVLGLCSAIDLANSLYNVFPIAHFIPFGFSYIGDSSSGSGERNRSDLRCCNMFTY